MEIEMFLILTQYIRVKFNFIIKKISVDVRIYFDIYFNIFNYDYFVVMTKVTKSH